MQEAPTPPPFNPQSPPPRPSSYLVWSVLATLFCCMPLGVVSIVYAAQVEGAYLSGDYERSCALSSKAKSWAIYSCVVGVAPILIYILLLAAYGVALIALLD